MTVYEHGTPDCVTVKVFPAIVSVPVRLDVAVLAAMLNVTVPPPDPVAPAVTDSHETLLAAVHAQPAPTVTVTVPLPALDVADWLLDEIEEEQDAAACVTVNVIPAIVSVPVRLAPVAVLAATLNATVPPPDPVAPPVTESHEVLLAAVHAQPAPAVTVLLPVPDAAVKDWLVGEIRERRTPG